MAKNKLIISVKVKGYKKAKKRLKKLIKLNEQLNKTQNNEPLPNFIL